MTTSQSNHPPDALSKRLRQLDATPIDTASLDRALASIIPQPEKSHRSSRNRFTRLVAVAAGLLVLISVSLVLFIPNRAVLAEPAMIAQMHQEMVDTMGGIPLTDMAAINATLRKQWEDSPTLPSAANMKAHDCCIKMMKNTRVAFVLLDTEGTHLTMAVAKSRDIALPNNGREQHAGQTWSIQKVGNLNMVMTESGPRWICLTGDMPAEKLMDIATKFLKD